MPIHQLMVANNVTIFFQGHDHLFARQQLDGITYQSLPNPADNTYTAFNADAFKSGDIYPNSGYVKVTVAPSSVTVDYIRVFLPQDEEPPQTFSGMTQFSYTIQARGSSQAAMTLGAGGSGYSRTLAAGGSVQAGYATTSVQSGSAPYGTAVFSLAQDGVVVSEAAVPPSPPTTAARLFVDYGISVPSGPAQTGAAPVDVYTGIAVVNPGTVSANVTYTLRNQQGQTLAVGHGTLAPGAHRARFLHQLQELAADFLLPSDFAAQTRYGSLEVSSS